VDGLAEDIEVAVVQLANGHPPRENDTVPEHPSRAGQRVRSRLLPAHEPDVSDSAGWNAPKGPVLPWCKAYTRAVTPKLTPTVSESAQRRAVAAD
jgi:hypothetical protein